MKSIISFFVLIIFLYIPFRIYAHPVDEIDGVKTYDQKQILTVGHDKITLVIDLTFYALDKTRLWDSIDLNKDREVTVEEKNIWMHKGQRSSWLQVNDKRVDFNPIALSFPDYYDFFSSKPAKVIVTSEGKLSVQTPSSIEYHYLGKDKPLAQIQFVARGEGDIAVDSITKPVTSAVLLHLKKGTQTEGKVLGVVATDRVSSFLNTYIKSDSVPFSVQMYALVIAMLLGAIHALTPGHGKAITAGYLVGSRGTVMHAIYLGLIITITHTSSVFILGAATLFLSAYIVPSTIIKTLNIISGILIIGFGLFLLFQRIRGLHREHTHHHHHDHDHSSMSLSIKQLLALGISGGIVPCVDALAILLVAVSLQKVLFGLIILVAFSVGLAFALTASGVAALYAKNKLFKQYTDLHKIEHYLGIVSAFVVTVLGVILLIKK